MRHLGGYLLFRTLSGLFGSLPGRVAARAGAVLGTIGYFVRPATRALVRRHMRRALAPGASRRRVNRTTRRAFASYGRYWAETFWIRPRRKAAVVAGSEVIGGERLVTARDEGNGVIVALPHVGNWEVAGAAAEDLGVPVLAVAESLPNPRITEWFVDCRRAFGIDVVVARKGIPLTPRLEARLRAGGTVALLADRDLKGTGIPVEFFGETTTFPVGPVALADRTGAALFPVGAYFTPGTGHRFIVYPRLELPAEGTSEERLAAGARLLAEAFEDIIRRAPEQWHLFQPNWPSDLL